MLLRFMARMSEAVARYCVAIANLGIVSTWRIVWARLLPGGGVCVLSTTKFGKIHWRREGDGVICHFYTPQIYLNCGADRVGVIIDAGANIGIESLRFAKLYPHAKIIALEADRDNAKILDLNVGGNDDISALNRGLWNKSTKLKVRRRTEDNQSFFVEEIPLSAGEFDIEAISVGGLIELFGLGEIDIFKIDIEGAERQLFDETCDAWLQLVRSFIIECPDIDAPCTTQRIYDAFRRNGITVNSYIHGENLVIVRSEFDWKPETVRYY